MWVERFRDAGEFEIVAPVSSGLKALLPEGTFISHIDTREVCVVENHEIEEKTDEDPKIKITGRSMEVILEDRIVGANNAAFWSGGNPGAAVAYADSSLAAGYPAAQAIALVNATIRTPDNDDDKFQGILCAGETITEGASEIRIFKRGTIYSALIALLEQAKAGICVIRKGDFGHRFADSLTDTYFYVHNGVDKTGTVFFSTDTGDVDNAQYLWSRKTLKNVALVSGQNIEVIVADSPLATGFDRKVMLVDGGDIDRDYPSLDAAGKTAVENAMRARGREALAAQRKTALASVDISRTHEYKYRTDYDIGDIVSVYANYGQFEQRRVIEYVEIEDDSGRVGYPTLAELEE